MPPIMRRYVVWVIFPVLVAFLGAHLLWERAGRAHSLTTAHRAGAMAASLFRTEMAERAAELTRTAPVLSDPDPSSPLIAAALGGDTVASLSHLQEGLALSVALREVSPPEEGSPSRVREEVAYRIRADRETFSARTPRVFRSRTGYGFALYLRGVRALAEPREMGPDTLPGNNHDGVLLPLDPSAASASAVHILVVPSGERQPRASLLVGAILVAVGTVLGFGLLLLRIGRLMKSGAPPPRTLLLAGVGLPLLALWGSLAITQGRYEDQVQQGEKGELVRLLALLKEAGPGTELEAGMAGSDVELTRTRGETVLESTLPDGPLLTRVSGLQPPPPTFPATGSVRTEGGAVSFASLKEEGGTVLTLTAPAPEEGLRTLRLQLAGLAGMASILGLIFLSGAVRSPQEG